MQTTGFALPHVHDFCINAVQGVADGFGWGLGYGKLRVEESGAAQDRFLWQALLAVGIPNLW
jgi:hypothetical protein